jgi:hypothetical protein
MLKNIENRFLDGQIKFIEKNEYAYWHRHVDGLLHRCLPKYAVHSDIPIDKKLEILDLWIGTYIKELVHIKQNMKGFLE